MGAGSDPGAPILKRIWGVQSWLKAIFLSPPLPNLHSTCCAKKPGNWPPMFCSVCIENQPFLLSLQLLQAELLTQELCYHWLGPLVMPSVNPL